MCGGDSELLLLMTNPKLPGDTRIILMNPLCCFELEYADLIADTVQRQCHLQHSHNWCEYDGETYDSVAQAAKARFLALPKFETPPPHVHMQGRGPDYKNTDDIAPTPIVSKLAAVLRKGHRCGNGDILFLSNNFVLTQGPFELRTGDEMHMTAFTVGAARKLLERFDSEIKPLLLEVRKEGHCMHIGIVLRRFILANHNWDAELSFGWLLPTFGHVLHFKEPMFLPISEDYTFERDEFWKYKWVGKMYMWKSETEMPYVQIFKMDRDELLHVVVDVPLTFPLSPDQTWKSFIEVERLTPKAVTSAAEFLKIDGKIKSAYDLPHAIENYPEESRGFTDYNESGETPTKKFKRAFRSGRTRYKNRIWTTDKCEADAQRCMHRCCMCMCFHSVCFMCSYWMSTVPSKRSRRRWC